MIDWKFPFVDQNCFHFSNNYKNLEITHFFSSFDMPLVTLKQLLEEADKKCYAVGAYNVNNMEQIQGIMNAAAKTKSPVILQASRGALKYSDLIFL